MAAEERRLRTLRVLLVRMNPHLAMGGDLLNKTGAGNLFMVFSEPDVDIRTTGDELEVEIRRRHSSPPRREVLQVYDV